MTDEPTGDDTEAGDVPTEAGDDTESGDAAPTESGDVPTEAQPAVEPDSTPAATSTDDRRPGVFIPRGVAILLGVLLVIGLVGGGGFALGRSTADDDHGDDQRVFVPVQPNGGNTNGNNNAPGNGGRQVPSPRQPAQSGGGYLGVQIATANGGTSGARVVRVASGSPADTAGLQVGDVITKVDGAEIANAQALFTAIRRHESGDKVTITYVRGGDTKTARVTLGTRPSSNSNSAPAVPS